MTKLKIESDSPEVTVLVYDNTDPGAAEELEKRNNAGDYYDFIHDLLYKIMKGWYKGYGMADEWSEDQRDFAMVLRDQIFNHLNDNYTFYI